MKKKALNRFDRVRRPSDSAATATLIDDHKDGGFSVLMDSGRKRMTMWDKAVRCSGPIKTCARCDAQDHVAIDCRDTPNEQPVLSSQSPVL